jgi:DnaJ-class molecular chaperone
MSFPLHKADKLSRSVVTVNCWALGLPECASIVHIKANYREQLYHWHPDRCPQDPQKAAEMTRQITEAYKTLMDYCNNYKYCFSEQTVKRHRPPENSGWNGLAMIRFGVKRTKTAETGLYFFNSAIISSTSP